MWLSATNKSSHTLQLMTPDENTKRSALEPTSCGFKKLYAHVSTRDSEWQVNEAWSYSSTDRKGT